MDKARDPLDDIGSLVEQTLNILGSSHDEPGAAGYERVALDTPEKRAGPADHRVTLDTVPINPLLNHPGPGLLSPEFSENIDLGSPMRPAEQHKGAGLGPVSEISAVKPTAAPGHLLEQQRSAGSNIRIKVKEPERTEGVATLGLKSQHWVYTVTIDSDLPGLEARGMEVRRRFSDFDALHKLLRSEYRGCFIPPLPQKTFIENNSEEFLRLRRADLQAFLRGVVAHPSLRHSEIVKVFLLQPSDLTRNPAWLTLAAAHAPKRLGLSGSDDAAASSSSTANNAALANLNNWVSWMKQSAIGVFQPPKRELPTDEGDLRQMKELLQDLERLLQLTTHSARTLCHDMEKLSTDFREFGFTMGMLSKYEETVQARLGQYTPEGHSASNRSADFTKFAACHAKQHAVWKALSLKAAANLVTLHDYYILIPEAVRALEEREAALEQAFVLEEDLADKKHQLTVAQSGGGGVIKIAGALVNQEKRLAQLSQSIATLEEQVKVSRMQYETIKEQNQSELSRLGLEREADIRSMMASFTSNQAQLVQSSADLWAALAAQFAA